MKTIRAELHVHTVLSPCAEIEMLPPLIVAEAIERGIHLIAITDHNASGNIQSVQAAATGTGLTVLPGMEIQTREEVHSLCLFDTTSQIFKFQTIVNQHLPSLKNQPDFFGEQLLVDAEGDFLAREDMLLLTSSSLTLEEACREVHNLGGLFIPAHINRTANGLIPLLGVIPAELPFDALEISRHIKPSQAAEKFFGTANYPIVQNGDVHRLEEFLGVNQFVIEELTIAEFRLALNNQEGRSHRILSLTGSEISG